MDSEVDTEFFADPLAAAKAAMEKSLSDLHNDNGVGEINSFDDEEDNVNQNRNSFEEPYDVDNDDGSNNNDNVDDDDVPIEVADDDDDDEQDDYADADDDGTDYLEKARVKLEEEVNDFIEEDLGDDVNSRQNDNGINFVSQQREPPVRAGFEEDTAPGATTVINGKGIWHSWTRNFASPLLALLDLLDNAFDAASLIHPGRIFIQPDLFKEPASKPRTTGLTLWNNSVTPIKPLFKVLEVYTSLKGSSANSIGENGVGLKQGCATLSNLSFCIVKSNGNQYSLGIIAYQLQTDFGCSLPSFTFESTNLTALRQEMLTKFTQDNTAVGDCVARYGSLTGLMPVPANRDRALERGIDRLIEKFQYVTNHNGWDKYPHVFGLVVDHLKHGEKGGSNSSKQTAASSTTNSPSGTSHNIADQPFRVNKILETLFQDLPKRYLHIPRSLDVRVGGQVVNFNYWQPRLVEMAQFDLKINRTANLIDVFSVKKPPGKNTDDNNDQDDTELDGSKKIVIPPDDEYTLRIYTGFDALRVCDDRAPKTASMYMYSRHSGRLIKANMDCRGELGLTSGGTDFCQGLTIIVDDYNANFPLNPTKQDVAFGEQSNGETHKRNLYIWLNAATRLYYMFYKDRVCNKQKRILTESLKLIEPKVRQLISQSATSFQSLSDCQFTTFGDFTSQYLMNSGQSIRLLPFRSIEYFLGKDSRLQLPPVPEHEVESVKPGPKARGPKPKSKTAASAESSRGFAIDEVDDDSRVNDDDDDDDNDEMYGSSQQLRRKRFISSKEVSKKRPDNGETVSSSSTMKIQNSIESNSNIANTTSKKRGRQQSLERSNSNVENTNYEHDLSFMALRIATLENENKQLKKDVKRARNEHITESKQNEQLIESLKHSKAELKAELMTSSKQVKALKQQVKDLIRSGASANQSIVSQLDDMSGSRLSIGDAAKSAKRLKNLKSNLDVLKSENDDLKEQIRSLESTITRKDKTIQAQRKLIDQRTLEDEEEESNNNSDEDVVDLGHHHQKGHMMMAHTKNIESDDMDDDSSI